MADKMMRTGGRGEDGLAKPFRTNNNGDQYVQLTGRNAIQANVQNVTTAGTRVQLPDAPCSELLIIAKEENIGFIYVGGSDVSSSIYGCKLNSEGSITLPVSNANLVYIDTSNDGDGVSYVAV